jgi:hypothetical protein
MANFTDAKDRELDGVPRNRFRNLRDCPHSSRLVRVRAVSQLSNGNFTDAKDRELGGFAAKSFV